MRSLVFIALLGLALAVPVPHDQGNIFESTEEFDPDCYADETMYEHGGMEEDLIIDNIEEEITNDDCNEDPIEEESILDVEIDIMPGQDEDSIIFKQEPEEIYDEECEDEIPTEEPYVEPPQPQPQPDPVEDNSDCYADESEPAEEPSYGDNNDYVPVDIDVDPLDTYNHSFVELDQVFEVENENEADNIDECIEY